MRKIVFLGILIFCVSIGIGFYFGRILINNKDKDYEEVEQISEKSLNIISQNLVIQEAVSRELKVRPNMEFGIKEYYDECGHFNFEYTELPKELVNMNRQEVEEHYNGNYEVEEFDENKLILAREINGMCTNHYVIKLGENDLIEVYKINTDTSYSLYETTDISKEFLPEDDIENLEEGIVVYGYGKVNSILEDYE